ncbi:hypothetical protein UlMin_022053 [Ulmus minor]
MLKSSPFIKQRKKILINNVQIKRVYLTLHMLYAGVEAKECIKIYLGMKVLLTPISVWVSSISFHSYADITFQSTSDGGKAALKTLAETNEEFLKLFQQKEFYQVLSIVSGGEFLPHKTSDGLVVRMIFGKSNVGPLYAHLILLVDVLSPDQKKTNQQAEILSLLPCFATVYRFYHYPATSRLRISLVQLFVIIRSIKSHCAFKESSLYASICFLALVILFTTFHVNGRYWYYHHKGYGRYLLEVLNDVSISEDVYVLKVEEPLDFFQHVVLVKTIKEDIIGKDSGTSGKQVIEVASDYDQEMSFAMFKSQSASGQANSSVQVVDENQPSQEEQLRKLVDERVKEIQLVAQFLNN